MEFNPLSPEVIQNPYPFYRELREKAPVCQTSLGFWAVTRYEDFAFVTKNPAIFSSSAMRFGDVLSNLGMIKPDTQWMIAEDPPVHTRLRNMVNRAFTPLRINQMEGPIRALVDGLLDKLQGRTRFDLVTELATPLPLTVIAEMLGVDVALQKDFKRWSDDLIGAVSGHATAENQANIERSAREFGDYFSQVIAERTARPQQDLVSGLIEASKLEGQHLTPDDVRAFALLLLVAGNETTTNLVGNTMIALMENPSELAKVRADPTLIPKLVEEGLRYDGPIRGVLRAVTQDVELGGVKLSAGECVMPVVASANRDDAKFPDGDRFDISRDTKGHVAFGHGIHFCLGAVLARLEARIVFERLIARFPVLALQDQHVPRIESFVVRGPQRVELTTVPRPEMLPGIDAGARVRT